MKKLWKLNLSFCLKKISILTSFPSGKQRQKKSGRGRPTASLIASVITAVISTANNRPALQHHQNPLYKYAHTHTLFLYYIFDSSDLPKTLW